MAQGSGSDEICLVWRYVPALSHIVPRYSVMLAGLWQSGANWYHFLVRSTGQLPVRYRCPDQVCTKHNGLLRPHANSRIPHNQLRCQKASALDGSILRPVLMFELDLLLR